jgi:hypothetical protein
LGEKRKAVDVVFETSPSDEIRPLRGQKFHALQNVQTRRVPTVGISHNRAGSEKRVFYPATVPVGQVGA